jgi:hypothetical protein
MPDPGFEIDDLAVLRECFDHMMEVGGDIGYVLDYIRDEACNQEGFTGLLEPLQISMGRIVAACETLRHGYWGRWTEFAFAVLQAGRDYDATDGHVSDMFQIKVPRGGRNLE